MRKFNAIKNAVNFGKGKKNTMKIKESKTEVTVENVVPINPQIIRILDTDGLCIAFVCVGANRTTVQIGVCHEDKFEVELEKEES